MTIHWVTPYDTPYPGGLPMYWRDEQSSLPAAVEAYLNDQTGGKHCSAEDIEMVRLYLKQWINAPCWSWNIYAPDEESLADLEALRRDIEQVKTADQIQDWLMRGLDLGIDPL